MTDVPEPPPAEPPAPPPPPISPPPPAAEVSPPAAAPVARTLPKWAPAAIGAALALVLVAGFIIWRTQFSGPSEAAYVVQPYTPPSELIAARERVPGYTEPDTASQVAVQFGQGVTLNVTGRVSRGLGNDWYAVAWNDQTVFVRTSDSVAGSGAPPAPIVREEEPEEEIEEEKLPEEEEGEVVAEFPEAPAPTYGLEISDVNWIREPTSRDFARYYPRDALEEGQSGRVVLDCEIGGNGRLSCGVAQESPGGYGFGQAGVNISRQLRVQSTLPDGSPAAGRRLRLPLSFRAG